MSLKSEILTMVNELEGILQPYSRIKDINPMSVVASSVVLLRRIAEMSVLAEAFEARSADHLWGLYLDEFVQQPGRELNNESDKIVIYLARQHRQRGVMWSKDALHKAVTTAKDDGLLANQDKPVESP